MKNRMLFFAVSIVAILIINTVIYKFQSTEGVESYQAMINEYMKIDPYDDRLDYSFVFDEKQYQEINPDIAYQIAEDKLFEHFIQIGMDEGRRANNKFDVRTYIENNNDLKELFEDNIRLYYYHYMLYGHSENRVII